MLPIAMQVQPQAGCQPITLFGASPERVDITSPRQQLDQPGGRQSVTCVSAGPQGLDVALPSQ
jgi:hypothetical protein